MENILVVGATGTTGRKVVNLLKSSIFFEPVAMVRKNNQVKEFLDQGIKTVVGNLEEDISHVVSNIDKVVFAAGSGGENVVEVDQEGAKKMIDASKKHAVKKFVMLSSMGAEQPEAAKELQDYLKAKHNADEYLKASKVPYTIVRPGSLTNEKGTGRIELGKILQKQGYISRDDVAKVLTMSLFDNATTNKHFEILSGSLPIEQALIDMSNK